MTNNHALEPQDGVLLSAQLENILKDKIVSREWKVHDRIPSEMQLSALYGVSRSTVRAAIGSLVEAGLLERKQGKGTFVAVPNSGMNFSGTVIGVRSKLDTQVPTPVSRIVRTGLVPASKLVADMLGMEEGKPVFEIIRARYKLIPGSTPVEIQYSYTLPEIGKKVDTDLLIIDMARLTLQIQERCGIRPVRVKEWIEASTVTSFEVKEMKVSPGSPVLLYDELSFSKDDFPYLFTRFTILGSIMRLSFG